MVLKTHRAKPGFSGLVAGRAAVCSCCVQVAGRVLSGFEVVV